MLIFNNKKWGFLYYKFSKWPGVFLLASLGLALGCTGLSEKPSSRNRGLPKEEIATLKGHENNILSLTFSPDGKYLASGSYKTIKIWRAEDWFELKTLNGHKRDVSSLAFSPDGKYLASASFDKTIKLWQVEGWRELITLKNHKDKVNSLAFSPDGKYLASGSEDETVSIWELKKKRELVVIGVYKEPGFCLDTLNLVLNIPKGHEVRSVAFSPDGRYLASGSRDWGINVFRVGEWEKQPVVLRGHEEDVNCVAFSPDGKYLASGSWDDTIKIWRIKDWREMTTLKGHKGGIWSLAFSPDGKYLASAGAQLFEETPIRIWRMGSWKEEGVLKGRGSWFRSSVYNNVRSVVFSPDGRYLAGAGDDKTINIWWTGDW